MKKLSLFLLACLCLGHVWAGNVLGKDTQYKKRVYAALKEKQQALPHGNLFSILKEKKLTAEERDALSFLYAYMPTADIVDKDGDYYLRQVRIALSTRQNTTWGKNIPDLIFRHFVLPVRVNNEALDEARTVFPSELLPRIQHLSAKDAILEVNHWCHEKVVYTPSDARTSAPLASVKTAYGRCGEESTFLVAALRSVGIPARQVYTPRWAHTNDNHAWVEAWADGEWYFLGACEPEPVLNLGWFNQPASRGMLMHTKVFGDYNGSEDVMQRTQNFTEINVTKNYASVGKAEVLVVDEANRPVSGINVEFKVFNYAEYFTVARKITDNAGRVSLEAGLGDMVVYAQQDGKFAFGKVSFGQNTLVTLRLSQRVGDVSAQEISIVPPVGHNNLPPVTDAQKAENDRRMQLEDSIRNAYVATFPTKEEARAFAERLSLDTAEVVKFIMDARGNYADIQRFLTAAQKDGKAQLALDMLEVISAKDLRDTPYEVLVSHLDALSNGAYLEVLNPRVSLELLTDYRRDLAKAWDENTRKAFQTDPMKLATWCKEHLKLQNELNTINIIASPVGTLRSRSVTTESRKVFFVAAARSLNIPAWYDMVDSKVYFAKNGAPVYVNFDEAVSAPLRMGELQLTYQNTTRIDDPAYYSHFTLARFEHGKFALLSYDEDNTSTWQQLFASPRPMQAGYYMLTAGNRLANGNVDSRISFFEVKEGQKTVTELIIPHTQEGVSVIGSFDSETLYLPVGAQKEVSILSQTGRGYFVIGLLEPNKEPTNHALKDIEKMRERIEAWGRPMIFLFANEQAYQSFRPQDFPNLPKNIVYGIDTNGKIRQQITENMKSPNGGALPILFIGDTFNRVVFESEGYTIGMGEQLLKVIDGL